MENLFFLPFLLFHSFSIISWYLSFPVFKLWTKEGIKNAISWHVSRIFNLENVINILPSKGTPKGSNTEYVWFYKQRKEEATKKKIKIQLKKSWTLQVFSSSLNIISFLFKLNLIVIKIMTLLLQEHVNSFEWTNNNDWQGRRRSWNLFEPKKVTYLKQGKQKVRQKVIKV